MEEQKETGEAKQIEVDKEMVYFENGEEGEDIQEESEEVEEFEEEEKEQEDTQEEIPINDEDLIPSKDNFNFQLNSALLTPLNNDSYTTEELIQKLIPEIQLNSKSYEEIGLYIYIHFLFRNSYEIFLNSSKGLSHKEISYFVDKKILPSFDMKKIMKYITENSLEFNFKEENKDKSKENNKIILELVKKEINQDDINPILCCKKKIDKSQKINIVKILLNYNLITKSMNTKGQNDLFTKIYAIYLFTKNKHLLPIAKSFLKLYSIEKFQPFTKDVYLSYVDKFLKENNEQEVNQIIEKDLKEQIKYFTEYSDQTSLFYIEKLLIQLMGHYEAKIRKRAVILLNILYDGHTFQLYEPFNPEIKLLKDDFKIEIEHKETPDGNEESTSFNFFLFLSTPFRTFFVLPDKIENETKMIFNFGKFKYCGYYDFVLIRADNLRPKLETKGRYIVQNNEITSLSIHSILIDSFLNNSKESTNKDSKNSSASKEKKRKNSNSSSKSKLANNLNNANGFNNIRDHIKKYAKQGINALYLIGVLDRDNTLSSSSPYSIIDRGDISKSFGSEKDFVNLIKEIEKYNIKIFLDSLSRISSSHFHRKYKNLLLNYTDKLGKVQLLYGGQGLSINYEDNMVLNYRDIDAWNLLITDILALIKKYSISGIHIDNAQLWPIINSIDFDEMFREEIDEEKSRRYTNYEIINGKIVLPNEECGFWNAFDIENLSEDIYPNPLFIKITKSIWEIFPEFIFIGEFNDKNQKYTNRQFILSKSGLIPEIYILPEVITHLYEINLGIDPLSSFMKKSSINHMLRAYNEYSNKNMPLNTQCIISSGNDIWPYPNLLFGNGALPYITALFTMDYIPMTFMDEIHGELRRNFPYSYFESSKIKKDNSQRRPNNNIKDNQNLIDKCEIMNSTICKYNINEIEDVLIKQNSYDNNNKNLNVNSFLIKNHYEQMRLLRKNHKSLLYGKLHFLKNENSKVLSYSRIDFEDNEIGIIAINFGDTAVCVDIDFNSMKKEYKDLDVNTIIKIENWSIKEQGNQYINYYFMEEIFSRKHRLEIMPYDSVMLGVSLVKPFNVNLFRKTFSDSLSELCKRISHNVKNNKKDNKSSEEITYDSNIISSQLKYLLNNNLSLCEFAKWLNTIQSILSKYNLKYFDYFKNLSFISENWKNSTQYFKYISLLNSLPPKSFEKYPKIYLYSEIIQKSSNYGPICFITPEIGRWSGITNLGRTIDDITHCLGLLGQDIIVISPYYHKNKDGKTNYLENDKCGFICLNSYEILLDQKYSFDIYFGKLHGVKLYFIKNEEIFPHPYSFKSSNEFLLLQMAIMGKASLALLNNIGVTPSLIVSNDWFTGFVPAFGKGGHFGETFKNTVFFHILHNFISGNEGCVKFNSNIIQNHNIFQIEQDLIIDKKNKNMINPNQCALLKCDQWGTISKSYLKDILEKSSLNNVLKQFSRPFGFSNGIFVKNKIKKIKDMIKSNLLDENILQNENDKNNINIDILSDEFKKKAKEKIQLKYFGQKLNEGVLLLNYSNEISEEGGINLILDNAENLIQNYGLQILISGKINLNPQKLKQYLEITESLSQKFPNNFFAPKKDYMTDNILISYGCDFGLILSTIETGNIIQHEYFSSGTPVIAYRIGGIRDTVSEYNIMDKKGNGIIYDNIEHNNFISAIIRAVKLFNNKLEYEQCRRNAYISAKDVMDVARAWATEFYRLKGKIFFDNKEVEKEKLEFNKSLEENTKLFDSEMSKYNDKDYIFNYDTGYNNNNNNNNISTNNKDESENISENEDEEDIFLNISFIYEVEKGKKYNLVQIAGSWDNWKEKSELKYDPLNNRWKCIKSLPKGKKFLYKYLLDGNWTVNKNEKTETKGDIVNNMIKIA